MQTRAQTEIKARSSKVSQLNIVCIKLFCSDEREHKLWRMAILSLQEV